MRYELTVLCAFLGQTKTIGVTWHDNIDKNRILLL